MGKSHPDETPLMVEGALWQPYGGEPVQSGPLPGVPLGCRGEAAKLKEKRQSLWKEATPCIPQQIAVYFLYDTSDPRFFLAIMPLAELGTIFCCYGSDRRTGVRVRHTSSQRRHRP